MNAAWSLAPRDGAPHRDMVTDRTIAYNWDNDAGQYEFKNGAGTASSPCFAGRFARTGDEAVPAPDLRQLESTLAIGELVEVSLFRRTTCARR